MLGEMQPDHSLLAEKLWKEIKKLERTSVLELIKKSSNSSWCSKSRKCGSHTHASRRFPSSYIGNRQQWIHYIPHRCNIPTRIYLQPRSCHGSFQTFSCNVTRRKWRQHFAFSRKTSSFECEEDYLWIHHRNAKGDSVVYGKNSDTTSFSKFKLIERNVIY